MTMRAAIERGTSPGTDDWGQPQPSTYSSLATDVPCRAWSTMRRTIRSDDKEVIIEDIRALVPAGTDVKTDDRVTVTNRRGTTLLGGPMVVQNVARQPGSQSNADHLMLMLTRHVQDTVN